MFLIPSAGFADRQFYKDWWNSCDWLEFCKCTSTKTRWNILTLISSPMEYPCT
jgi:hypothetical protein